MIAVTSLPRDEARALLSVLGALLAAYGFFYTGVKDRLGEAKEIDWSAFRTQRDLKPGLEAAQKARLMLGLLVGCAALVAVLFVPVAAPVVVDVGRRRPYAPDKAALVVVVAFWVALAIGMGWRMTTMTAKIRKGRERSATLPPT